MGAGNWSSYRKSFWECENTVNSPWQRSSWYCFYACWRWKGLICFCWIRWFSSYVWSQVSSMLVCSIVTICHYDYVETWSTPQFFTKIPSNFHCWGCLGISKTPTILLHFQWIVQRYGIVYAKLTLITYFFRLSSWMSGYPVYQLLGYAIIVLLLMESHGHHILHVTFVLQVYLISKPHTGHGNWSKIVGHNWSILTCMHNTYLWKDWERQLDLGLGLQLPWPRLQSWYGRTLDHMYDSYIFPALAPFLLNEHAVVFTECVRRRLPVDVALNWKWEGLPPEVRPEVGQVWHRKPAIYFDNRMQ